MPAEDITGTLVSAGITSQADQDDFDSWAIRSPVEYARAIQACIKGDKGKLGEMARRYAFVTTPDEAYLSSKGYGTYTGSDGHRMAVVRGQHVRASCRSLRVPMPDCTHREPIRDAVAMPLSDGVPVFELKQQ